MFNWAKRALTLGLTCLGSFGAGVGLNIAAATAQSDNVVVYVNGSDQTTLNLVRQVVSNPIVGSVDGQSSVIAGAFDQASADVVTQQLKSRGLAAQQTLYRTQQQVANTYTYPTQYQYVASNAIAPCVQQAYTGSTTYTTVSNYGSNYGGNTVLTGTETGGFSNGQNRYVAAIPLSSGGTNELLRVRQIIPTAFIAKSNRGSYIYAGGYPNRDSAESLTFFLRSRGIDARVLYF
ncbi:hypothetical protein V2H45_07195 [Tumidithrix elongata RA019]|uniref:Uncharacterized protein n=1 Tax=Tumidithrix elongata BACA0141 TaxID=2716417 RepID=A0AAW9Q1N1_9CYAN|nr:hypothetical protein [Tumidithrix elongata RA019]